MSGKKSHTIFPSLPDCTPWLQIAPACALFILLSLWMIPLVGLQEDELLFAAPYRLGVGREFILRAFKHDFPLMVMSYVGSLKTALLFPIWKAVGASVWSVRLPALLFGVGTIILFSYLAAWSGGQEGRTRRVVLGTMLLASQAIFLLTNVFDWGPVALEHLLLTAACVAFVAYARRTAAAQANDIRFLRIGSGLLGLALWNKAIFVWALAGVCVGGLVFLKEIRALVSWRSLTHAALFFVLGASPCLLYNLRHSNATVRENAHFDSPSVLPGKLLQLEQAADGGSLFVYLAMEEWAANPKAASSYPARMGGWVRDHVGQIRNSRFSWAFLALVACVPLWWPSRAARFSLVFCVVCWLAMAWTKDAGASAHHSILLWPFPVLFVVVVLDRIRWSAVVWVVGGALIVLGVLNENQYLYQLERFGPGDVWTDASPGLVDSLARIAPNGAHVWIMDWGIGPVVDALSKGRYRVSFGSGPFMQDPPPGEVANPAAEPILEDSDAVFVGHVSGRELFEGVARRTEAVAKHLGLSKIVLATVADTNGRAVFEIFRWRSLR